MFTPFWKTCLSQPMPAEPEPHRLRAPRKWPDTLPLADLHLEPRIKWAEGFRAVWRPGTQGAQLQLKRFLREAIPYYNENCDRPDLGGTSRLSPYLHFGEISPRQVWHAIRESAKSWNGTATDWRACKYLTEIGWREFAHHRCTVRGRHRRKFLPRRRRVGPSVSRTDRQPHNCPRSCFGGFRGIEAAQLISVSFALGFHLISWPIN